MARKTQQKRSPWRLRERSGDGWKARLLGWFGLVALLASGRPTEATTLVLLTEKQMVEQSALILRGKVVKKQAVWTAQKTAIVTLVTLRGEEEALGRPFPREVVVGHYGGKIGEIERSLEGGPEFVVGEEVLVFLHPNPHLPKEYLLTGWTQGKWTIQRPMASFSPKEAAARTTVRRPPLHPHLRWVRDGEGSGTQGGMRSEEPLEEALLRLRSLGKNVGLRKPSAGSKR